MFSLFAITSFNCSPPLRQKPLIRLNGKLDRVLPVAETWHLKSQRQIWDILQGVTSLGV